MFNEHFFKDLYSPWTKLSYFRLNSNHSRILAFRDQNDNDIEVKIEFLPENSYNIVVNSHVINDRFENVDCEWIDSQQQIITNIGDKRYKSRVILENNKNAVIFTEVRVWMRNL